MISISLSDAPHLCKVLLGDPSGPLDAELQRPAGVCYIGALDQHPLYQQTVLRRVPDIRLAVAVAVHALCSDTRNSVSDYTKFGPFGIYTFAHLNCCSGVTFSF